MSREGSAENVREPETDAVRQRYARRLVATPTFRYHMLNPTVWQVVQERQRATLKLLREQQWMDLSERRVLEVGCGSGGNLLELLRFGFSPQYLQGVELLPERCQQARAMLPAAVQVTEGDALALQLPSETQDLVLVSTVFSSLLDDDFQQRLAAALWRWVKPGGAVLWYDFVVDNPRNPDVRGVPVARLRELFPQARMTLRRVTLAPPLARAVCRLHPALYTVLNTLPPLRTHVLGWLAKD